jgi:hypothetical protein
MAANKIFRGIENFMKLFVAGRHGERVYLSAGQQGIGILTSMQRRNHASSGTGRPPSALLTLAAAG